MKLLDIAGFKESNATTPTGYLTLVHSNPAVLSVILQRIGETVQRRKSEKVPKFDPAPVVSKKTKTEGETSNPRIVTNQKVNTASVSKDPPTRIAKESKPKKPLAKALTDTMSVAIRFGDSGDSTKGSFNRGSTLKEALDSLLKEKGISWDKIEIRYPNPRSMMKLR